IDVVQRALRSHAIENVASWPEPHCILHELGDSSARYAARYFLSDFTNDDATDAVVRTRIYFALTRAGIPLSIPAHPVFMTEDSTEGRQHKREVDRERRQTALPPIALFSAPPPEERSALADSLPPAPFTAGEVLTRRGADAHHLYVITDGKVS